MCDVRCDVVVRERQAAAAPSCAAWPPPGPATLSTFIVKDGKATKINRSDGQWLVHAVCRLVCTFTVYNNDIAVLPLLHSLAYQ